MENVPFQPAQPPASLMDSDSRVRPRRCSGGKTPGIPRLAPGLRPCCGGWVEAWSLSSGLGIPVLDTDFHKRAFSFPTSLYHRDEHPNEEDAFSNSIPPRLSRLTKPRCGHSVLIPTSHRPRVRGLLRGPWAPNPSILVREDPRGAWGCWPANTIFMRGSGLVSPLSPGRL